MPDPTRHIAAFRALTLPGRHRRLRLGAEPIGWVLPGTADELAALGATQAADGIAFADTGALDHVARALMARGRFRDRREAFDVRAEDGRVLTTIDRGALPTLGIEAWGAHLNGLVARPDGMHLWVARRGDDRPLDPGKLDQLAAGGIPAGLGPEETLEKEGEEEAGIPPELTRQARRVGEIRYAIERAEGLRRDRLFCFDLMLPEDFTPRPVDGEIAGFELWPLAEVLERVARTDDFKFNVNLVLIDLFRRQGLLKDDRGFSALIMS